MASGSSAMQDPSTEINFVNFNQDCSSLAIGTRTGYKLLSLSSVDKLELIYESACRCLVFGFAKFVIKCAAGTSPLLKDFSPPPFLPSSLSPLRGD